MIISRFGTVEDWKTKPSVDLFHTLQVIDLALLLFNLRNRFSLNSTDATRLLVCANV